MLCLKPQVSAAWCQIKEQQEGRYILSYVSNLHIKRTYTAMYHEVTEKFILEIAVLSSKLLGNGTCGYQSEKEYFLS